MKLKEMFFSLRCWCMTKYWAKHSYWGSAPPPVAWQSRGWSAGQPKYRDAEAGPPNCD